MILKELKGTPESSSITQNFIGHIHCQITVAPLIQNEFET